MAVTLNQYHLNNLKEALQDIRSKWRGISKGLNISLSTVQLATDGDCLEQVLSLWIRSDGACVHDLLRVLRESVVNEPNVADKLCGLRGKDRELFGLCTTRCDTCCPDGPVPKPSSGARGKDNGLEQVLRAERVAKSQLEQRVEELDIHFIAEHFDDAREHSDNLGLSKAEKTDVNTKFFMSGNGNAMKLCLTLWRKRNPFAATFEELLRAVIALQKWDTATDICKYLHLNYPSTEPPLFSEFETTVATKPASPGQRRANCSPHSNTPDLSLSQLLPELLKASSAWYSIGVMLRVPTDNLQCLQSQYPSDNSRCMTEVLRWWFDNSEVEVTSIINALNNVNKKTLAKELIVKFDVPTPQSQPMSPMSAPVITQQPPRESVSRANTTLTLSVVSQDTADVRYQWVKHHTNGTQELVNGEVYTGSRSRELVIKSVSSREEGLYSCLVSNSAATVESTQARIRVINSETRTFWPLFNFLCDFKSVLLPLLFIMLSFVFGYYIYNVGFGAKSNISRGAFYYVNFWSSTLDVKPDLPQIRSFHLSTGESIDIAQKIAGSGYERFSTLLLNDKDGDQFKVIADSTHGGTVQIVCRVITRWLQSGGATWRTLVGTLHKSGLISLANQIENNL